MRSVAALGHGELPAHVGKDLVQPGPLCGLHGGTPLGCARHGNRRPDHFLIPASAWLGQGPGNGRHGGGDGHCPKGGAHQQCTSTSVLTAQASSSKTWLWWAGGRKACSAMPLSDGQIAAALKDPATEINIQNANPCQSQKTGSKAWDRLRNTKAPIPFRKLQQAEPIGKT